MLFLKDQNILHSIKNQEVLIMLEIGQVTHHKQDISKNK